MASFSEWSTFYEVLGSASAALTGLQFITVALISDTPLHDPRETQASDAFATPTIVHFVSALLLAVLGAAPWHRVMPIAVLWGILGSSGLTYSFIAIQRMRSQGIYEPVLEDWAFHAVLPVAGYAVLIAAAFLARPALWFALALVAVSAVLLLLVGIHNAWDNLNFIALRKRKEHQP